jgi:hypothetical protein
VRWYVLLWLNSKNLLTKIVGRDNTGWMYAGMACRLAFDIGLHLDCRNMGLPESEVQIRDMTLWACVVYDKLVYS